MKVGIDATLLRDDRLTGVERYIINLVKELVLQNTEYEIYIFFRNKVSKYLDDSINGRFVPIVIRSRNRVLVDQLLIPFYTWKLKISLVHFPVFGAPLLYRGKSILTIHDATFWLFPESISKGGKFYYKPLFNQSIKRANKIITVSESSRNDLTRIFNLAPDKIVTIYEAVDDNFLSLYNDDEFDKSDYYKYKHNYILSVGTIEPRKNLKTLLEAFKIIKEKYHYDVKLLLTGRMGWIEEISIPPEVKKDIIFTGFVDEKLLSGMYRNALIYVFPSMYEGFGFPLLEAFASGIPVIASNNSSLKEVGGNACLYAETYMSVDFANAIQTLLTDKKRKQELIDNGHKRLKQFSWEQCAKQTLEVYKLTMEENA